MEKRHSTVASSRWRPRAPSSAPTQPSAMASTSRCCRRRTTRSCSPPAPPPGATFRCPAASSPASTRRWSTCRWANRVQEGDLPESPIDVAGKHVVIIGGGDTGADCLGTAHRQGAASVTQLEIMPQPPATRRTRQPVAAVRDDLQGRPPPTRRAASGCTAVNTERFIDDGNGNVRPAHPRGGWSTGRFEKVEGSDRELPADFVFLAMGFVGPEKGGGSSSSASPFDPRGNVARDADYMTNVPGVFVAGDMGRGQSLIAHRVGDRRPHRAPQRCRPPRRWLMGESSSRNRSRPPRAPGTSRCRIRTRARTTGATRPPSPGGACPDRPRPRRATHRGGPAPPPPARP
jgi:hypothetical protein